MSTTVSKLEVELTLDSKHFEAKIRGSKEALAAFTGVIGKADSRVRRHEKNVRNLGTSFRHTIVTLGLLRDAIRTAWHVTGGLVQGIVDVTAEFERLNILLKGMSQGTTEIQRATDATEQFMDVIELAKSAPFTVKELTNSWVKYKSVGIDPAVGGLKALVDAVSAFGGTDDILHRATIAVQQMAGKGVISMEELRQQMGEAVPQAMVLLARGMNMSVGDMVRAIAKGSVIAQPALRKLFAEFDLTFGGAAIDLMNTYIGSLARLDTVWQLTLREMGEASGLFEAVKEEVKRLTVELDDPAVRRFGIDVAVGMVNGFKILVKLLRESVEWLDKHAKAVWSVVAAWGAFRAMSIVKHMLAVGVATKGVTRALSLLAAMGMAKVAGNTARAAAASGLLAKSFGAVGKAIRMIKLPGWIGIMLTVVATIGTWIWANDKLTESNERGMVAVRKYKEAVEEFDLALAKEQIAAQEKTLAAREKAYKDIVEAVKDSVGEEAEAYRKALATMEADIIKMRQRIAADVKEIDDAIFGAARRAADQASREMVAKFRLGMEAARNIARSADAELNKAFAAEGSEMTVRERLEKRLVIYKTYLAEQTKFTREQLAIQTKRRTDAEKVIAAAAKGENVNIWIAQRDEAIKTMAQISATSADERARIATNLSTIYRDTSLLDAAGLRMEGYASSLVTLLTNARAKFAGMNAEMFDGMKELAAFESKVKSGKFGDFLEFTPEMLADYHEILAVLKDVDRIGDELKAKNAFATAVKTAEKTLAAAKEEAIIFGEAVAAGLDEVPNSRVRRFRRLFAKVTSTLAEGSEEMREWLALKDELLKAGADTTAYEKTLEIRKEIKELDVAGIQNARDRFEAEQALFDQMVDAFLLENAQAENIKELTGLYEQLRQKRAEAFEDSTPMKRMLKDWEDTRGKLEASYASWMDSFVNTFVDGIAEGKMAFKDFAKSLLSDLLRILLRALVVRAVMATIGGATEIDTSRPEGFGIDKWGFAKGGIMGPDGPISRYARGGIATKPQIAVFGEGRMNEAYVPLPDGRSIPVSMSGGGSGEPPDVTVNVINETGVPVDAEQDGGLEFDGEGYVLNVVLKAASRPGAFRDGLKTATT